MGFGKQGLNTMRIANLESGLLGERDPIRWYPPNSYVTSDNPLDQSKGVRS